MKTKPIAIVFILLFTIISTAGQYFYKIGAIDLELNLVAIITNYNIFLGLFFYGIGAIIFTLALKNARLSVIYPFVSLSYVWVALLSFFILNELLILFNWLGIFFIVVGISLVGYGAENG